MRSAIACGIVLLALLGLARPARAAEQRSHFDHLTTGFELLGRHRDLPCEACHVNAVFRGTPRDCVACHGAGTAVRATAKPSSHILTTDRCGSCHTPVAWLPAASFDHTQTLGSCSGCHDNVQAQGKSAQHLATGLECNACHDTLGWGGAVFNHAGISGNCARCHGTSAPGMPPNHIPTAGAPCEDCHSPTQFTTFAGATMDHAAVSSIPCTTCHEAGKSFAGTPPVTTRPPSPHPSTGECSACHTTASWSATDLPANHIPLPAADGGNCALCHANQGDFSVYVMNHVNISSNCAQCHGPSLAFANMAPPTLKEPPVNHIPYNGAPCEDCHSPSQFTTFDGAMMDHAVVSSTPCTTCHEAGKSFAGTPAVTTRPPSPHPSTGECSNCHTTSNWDANSMPANHIPLPAADAGKCSLCHTNPSDYSVYSMNHVNISSNCAQCHGPNLAFANMAPPTLKEPPINHIPYNGAPCEDCHSPVQFTTFDGSTMDHAVVSSMACTTCHETGKSFAGTPVVTTRPPPPHPTTGDCSNCHTTASWDSGNKRQVRPAAATAKTPGTAGAGPRTTVSPFATGTAAAMTAGRLAASRSGIAAGLALARRPAAAAVQAGLPLQHVDHSQLAGACISCHDGRAAAGPPIGHPRTSARCDSCHTTNAWLPVRFDHLAMAPRSCLGCHDGLRAMGKPRDHLLTTQSCDACHGTLAWRPVRVDHSGFISGCARCHNNVAAIGLTLTHLRTARDCSACHRYPDWGMVMPATPTAAPAGAKRKTKTIGSPPLVPRRRTPDAPF